ncbi:hypothetical protein [Orrella sp. 11846]|uniref:hypothetical protein n=1 Tax=Orrella sp. 11846 TaxID=3409913 RepID=UPI003B5B7027
MAVIDLVKWDGNPFILAWHFPSDQLSTWTQLIVNETQVKSQICCNFVSFQLASTCGLSGSSVTIASDLYVQLDSPEQNTYWFTFNVSQGYGGISVFPVTDPYQADGPRDLLGNPFGDNPKGSTSSDVFGALRALPMDESRTVLFEPPMRTDPAPPYWMFPELGRVLCYEPGALSDNPRIEREGMPRGAFKLVKCLPQPHPEANP